MMSDIDISCIIPIYNYSIYIPYCINSIFNQNLDIEIILVNNSENNINKLMVLYEDKFDNISIIHNEFNDYVDLNSIIKQTRGKYVIFIDSNDFIEESMFKKMFQICEENNLDFAMCKLHSMDDLTYEFDNDLHDLSLSIFDGFKKEIFAGLDVLDFITEIYSKPFNKLFRRSFLLDENISYPNFLFGDEVFFYDALLNAKKIAIVEEELYIRRFNNRFTKNIVYTDFSDIINAFLLIREKFIEVNVWKSCKSKIYNHFIKLILYYFNITPIVNKEIFFNTFKKNLQTVLMDDNIVPTLNSNNILTIKRFMNSSNYDEFLKQHNKIFSVVIPCFNVEDYVGVAIESVVNQTLDFENYVEIILVDDGSSDGTINVCKEFVDKYPNNIKLIHQQNEGIVSARNLSLKYASGKYVNFLDANITLKEDILSNAYNFFEQHYNEISYLGHPIFFFGNNYFEFNEEYSKIFSVVIPCFNVEDYVEDAVESVVNQTLDFESY